tara:strand:+ start:630860 stop:631105 length:246 start_codon:yes stop_codon:yes gene_type:complete
VAAAVPAKPVHVTTVHFQAHTVTQVVQLGLVAVRQVVACLLPTASVKHYGTAHGVGMVQALVLAVVPQHVSQAVYVVTAVH